MPRLTHKLPKYALHKPSGQARVKWGGRSYYLGKHGSQESHEAYAKFIANLPKPAESVLIVGGSPLVGEIVLKYLAHCRQRYVRDGVQTGEAGTIKAALTPLVSLCATLPVEDFGPRRLKELREYTVSLGWTRYTINRSIGRVKQCFTWCASEELIPATVAVALSTVKGLRKHESTAREKSPVTAVTDEDINAVKSRVSELVADVVSVMRLTGGRPSEIVDMRVDQIDRTDPENWKYVPGHHKCEHHGQSRFIPIGPQARAIIRPRLLRAGTDGRLFPITEDSLRQAIHRGCERAKIGTFNPNQIRHRYATEVRKTHGLQTAQILLGHAKLGTTQVYAEINMREAEEIARKIG